VCTLVAVFIPFKYLDDTISAGVLLSFNLTNSSLVIVRKCSATAAVSSSSSQAEAEAETGRTHNSPPSPCKKLLTSFNALAFAASLLFANIELGSYLVIKIHKFSLIKMCCSYLLF
jgi:hypothetical protein